MSSRKSGAAESDEVEIDGPSEESPSKRKRSSVASTTMKNGDKVKPSTSKKDVQPPKSKSMKSLLTTTNTGGNSGSKSTRKKQKAVPEPVEAESEESEEEWVGFGHASEESEEGEESEGEDEDEGREEGSDDPSEELLHGLSSDDGQDSSDEEVEFPAIDVSKLPTIAKDDKIVKQKLEKAKRQPVCTSFTKYPAVFRGLNVCFVD